MSALLAWVARLVASLERAEQTRRERWLAESADVYELERRIRDLERNAAHSAW